MQLYIIQNDEKIQIVLFFFYFFNKQFMFWNLKRVQLIHIIIVKHGKKNKLYGNIFKFMQQDSKIKQKKNNWQQHNR
jgi:hypothetical protein